MTLYDLSFIFNRRDIAMAYQSIFLAIQLEMNFAVVAVFLNSR